VGAISGPPLDQTYPAVTRYSAVSTAPFAAPIFVLCETSTSRMSIERDEELLAGDAGGAHDGDPLPRH
jgi:hypothetical protein